jgi:release factor glutamine methyltransferase
MTAHAAILAAAARLAASGIPDSRLDARLLAAAVLGVDPKALFGRPEFPLSPDQSARLDAFVARRAAREPVSRIIGRRGFWTLDLMLGPDTLDPRPDSETLVEAVLARIDRAAALSILDFGTGSGCLLLALLSELPAATGLGVDVSAGALEIARTNAEACGLAARCRFALGDWGRGLTGFFDAIVANPPYIADGDIAGLAPEVRVWDPHAALAGGADGLDAYRALAPEIARLLAAGGLTVVEVGAGQARAVTDLLAAAGLAVEGSVRDLAGIERCVVARRLR